jgi:hypothetical protein
MPQMSADAAYKRIVWNVFLRKSAKSGGPKFLTKKMGGWGEKEAHQMHKCFEQRIENPTFFLAVSGCEKGN